MGVVKSTISFDFRRRIKTTKTRCVVTHLGFDLDTKTDRVTPTQCHLLDVSSLMPDEDKQDYFAERCAGGE